MRNKKTYQYNFDGSYVTWYKSTAIAALENGVSKEAIKKVLDKYPERSSIGYYWSSKYFNNLFTENNSNNNKIENDKPNILIFDIETAPSRAYIWARYKQNIYQSQVLSEWFILTVSAKWLSEDYLYSFSIKPEDVLNEDDSRVTRQIHKLFDEADIVVAHNADKFDVPKLNTRFIINELPPVSPYKVIDTLKVVKKKFAFSSNKLDDLATYFGFDNKISTSFQLWSDVLKGDFNAIRKMSEYNNQDVYLLENIYLKLRPWIDNHPNVGIYTNNNKSVCSHCGSYNIIDTGKFYYTNSAKYKAYRCNNCGALNKSRYTELDKKKNKSLIVSTPK